MSIDSRFKRKSQRNVWRYTKRVDRNPLFYTPFVFNEIDLKMQGNVFRFHICVYCIAKFTEYREIFKRKFENIKSVDGNLLLNSSFVLNEIGLKILRNVYRF